MDLNYFKIVVFLIDRLCSFSCFGFLELKVFGLGSISVLYILFFLVFLLIRFFKNLVIGKSRKNLFSVVSLFLLLSVMVLIGGFVFFIVWMEGFGRVFLRFY